MLHQKLSSTQPPSLPPSLPIVAYLDISCAFDTVKICRSRRCNFGHFPAAAAAALLYSVVSIVGAFDSYEARARMDAVAAADRVVELII